MPTLDPTAIPAQPAPADEATLLSELLGDGELVRFALSFDGYEHFGDRWQETLQARQEEWSERGTLPRDIDALRGLLFLTFRQERFLTLDDDWAIHGPGGEPRHAPDPELITEARRDHERFKHALLARMRELAEQA